MEKSNYNKNLKQFARKHRKQGTKGEAMLWKFILKSNKTGFTFNRQYPIDNYIVDFICRKLKLIIEIDGNSHELKPNNNDYERQKKLESLGYQFIRFSEFDVVRNLEAVSRNIEFTINSIDEELNN